MVVSPDLRPAPWRGRPHQRLDDRRAFLADDWILHGGLLSTHARLKVAFLCGLTERAVRMSLRTALEELYRPALVARLPDLQSRADEELWTVARAVKELWALGSPSKEIRDAWVFETPKALDPASDAGRLLTGSLLMTLERVQGRWTGLLLARARHASQRECPYCEEYREHRRHSAPRTVQRADGGSAWLWDQLGPAARCYPRRNSRGDIVWRPEAAPPP